MAESHLLVGSRSDQIWVAISETVRRCKTSIGVKLIHILSDEFLYRVAIVVGIDMLLKDVSKSALVLFLDFAKLEECTKISVTALLI